MLKEWLGMAEGILQDLHQDHEQVSSRLERLQKTEGGAERTSLFKELARACCWPTRMPSRMFSTRRWKNRTTRRRAASPSRAPTSTRSSSNVLRELVNHHVKEEESTGFTCARREFDSEELEKMSGQFRRQKEKLMAEA